MLHISHTPPKKNYRANIRISLIISAPLKLWRFINQIIVIIISSIYLNGSLQCHILFMISYIFLFCPCCLAFLVYLQAIYIRRNRSCHWSNICSFLWQIEHICQSSALHFALGSTVGTNSASFVYDVYKRCACCQWRSLRNDLCYKTSVIMGDY